MRKRSFNNFFGYIEGYYGKLLRWEERLLIIKKMNLNNMNSYLYAPKEDLYHRYEWRKPYDKNWISNFKNFCKFSK